MSWSSSSGLRRPESSLRRVMAFVKAMERGVLFLKVPGGRENVRAPTCLEES